MTIRQIHRRLLLKMAQAVSHKARKRVNQKIRLMNRRSYILLLLFLSWPVNNLYRFIKWPEVKSFRPFMLNNEVVDPEWYGWHLGGAISYTMIYWAVWLYMNGNYKKDAAIMRIFGALFIVQATDIINYTCFQRHLFGFFIFQGFVIAYAGIINLWNLRKRNGAKR